MEAQAKPMNRDTPQRIPPNLDELILVTRSGEETQALGRAIGEAVQESLVIALQGDLGAGKTTLTQGIAAGLGVSHRVTSPTFTLVSEYPGRDGARLLHVDSYRLGDSSQAAQREASTFGMEEILEQAEAPALGEPPAITVVVIEWAERLAELLPPDHLAIHLEHLPDKPDSRRLRLVAHGPRSRALLGRVAQAWTPQPAEPL